MYSTSDNEQRKYTEKEKALFAIWVRAFGREELLTGYDVYLVTVTKNRRPYTKTGDDFIGEQLTLAIKKIGVRFTWSRLRLWLKRTTTWRNNRGAYF